MSPFNAFFLVPFFFLVFLLFLLFSDEWRAINNILFFLSFIFVFLNVQQKISNTFSFLFLSSSQICCQKFPSLTINSFFSETSGGLSSTFPSSFLSFSCFIPSIKCLLKYILSLLPLFSLLYFILLCIDF